MDHTVLRRNSSSEWRSDMKGITIQLLEKTEPGKDAFNNPTYTESWVNVNNVLVGEPSSEDITDTYNLTGKHLAFVLAIPKGDTHRWNDTQVRFWGQTFRTIGFPTQGIESLIPLDWNMKVKVERYG